MLNQSILEGLKQALAKGESLREAMMSFYSAGYDKKDIEEAARALHMQEPLYRVEQHPIVSEKPIKQLKPLTQQPHYETPEKIITEEKEVFKKEIVKTPLPSFDTPTEPKFFKPQPYHPDLKEGFYQHVSGYTQKKPNPNKKLFILLLTLFFLCLLGVLAAVIFYKEQVTELINSVFG